MWDVGSGLWAERVAELTVKKADGSIIGEEGGWGVVLSGPEAKDTCSGG